MRVIIYDHALRRFHERVAQLPDEQIYEVLQSIVAAAPARIGGCNPARIASRAARDVWHRVPIQRERPSA